MLVCPGSNTRDLSRTLANALDMGILSTNIGTFPDGEVYIRIEDYERVKGEEIILVQSLYAPQERNLFTLLNMAATLYDLGAKKVWSVIPYLCYSRADRAVLKGEAVSAKTVLKLIEAVGITDVFVIDIHNEKICDFTKMNCYNVFPTKDFAKFLRDNGAKPDVVVAPDKGAKKRAQLLAEELGVEHTFMHKFRDPYTGKTTTQIGDLPDKHREAVLVDDIVSTGGSLVDAAKILRLNGVEKVHVVVSHVVGQSAYQRLKSTINGLIGGTTSIPSPISIIDITTSLSDAIRAVRTE